MIDFPGYGKHKRGHKIKRSNLRLDKPRKLRKAAPHSATRCPDCLARITFDGDAMSPDYAIRLHQEGCKRAYSKAASNIGRSIKPVESSQRKGKANRSTTSTTQAMRVSW